VCAHGKFGIALAVQCKLCRAGSNGRIEAAKAYGANESSDIEVAAQTFVRDSHRSRPSLANANKMASTDREIRHGHPVDLFDIYEIDCHHDYSSESRVARLFA
jgi:hypothetical protein